ncbi:hypothetical protein [Listeria newyorkensis]|uniref:hypothetical protein n=1 Tax=Listeria newyorkensis TaxID=1497681 RepID=UPI00117D0B63|nr:hypothetical protein [Listeria newyorkensis]
MVPVNALAEEAETTSTEEIPVEVENYSIMGDGSVELLTNAEAFELETKNTQAKPLLRANVSDGYSDGWTYKLTQYKLGDTKQFSKWAEIASYFYAFWAGGGATKNIVTQRSAKSMTDSAGKVSAGIIYNKTSSFVEYYKVATWWGYKGKQNKLQTIHLVYKDSARTKKVREIYKNYYYNL